MSPCLCLGTHQEDIADRGQLAPGRVGIHRFQCCRDVSYIYNQWFVLRAVANRFKSQTVIRFLVTNFLFYLQEEEGEPSVAVNEDNEDTSGECLCMYVDMCVCARAFAYMIYTYIFNLYI